MKVTPFHGGQDVLFSVEAETYEDAFAIGVDSVLMHVEDAAADEKDAVKKSALVALHASMSSEFENALEPLRSALDAAKKKYNEQAN
jgi:hypothetical protein